MVIGSERDIEILYQNNITTQEIKKPAYRAQAAGATKETPVKGSIPQKDKGL
jgi:hypothetical protein